MSKFLSYGALQVYNHGLSLFDDVKIYSIALCSEALSCLHVENHVKISFIVLCNQDLMRHKEEIQVKISFIVLCN